MAKEHLLFDKTELNAVVRYGNTFAMRNLKYSDIQSISLKPCSEKGLFGSKPSEMIELKVIREAFPIVYYKGKEKQFWDSYKAGLRKFAKANRITLDDELDGNKAEVK